MARYKVGDFVAFMKDRSVVSRESEGSIVEVRSSPTPQDPQRVVYLVAELTYGDETELFELSEDELLEVLSMDEEEEEEPK